jgi:hypothetical protein
LRTWRFAPSECPDHPLHYVRRMSYDFIIEDENETMRPALSGWESVVFQLEDEAPVVALAELRAAIEAAERLVEAWGG